MGVVIGVIAQGMMGAGVGRRLHEGGAEVRTLLLGRSPASAERARAAGMVAMADEHALLAGADFFLSILPPGEAEPLARRLAPTRAHFVDAGIIGGPPRAGYKGPSIYASGEHVREALPLRDWGINLRAIEGPIGAASAVKMSYAGITKGTTAIAAAMLLGAARFGCGEALIAELSKSQPEMLKRMRGSIPTMYDKAYRWVGEMEEISDFHGPNKPAAVM